MLESDKRYTIWHMVAFPFKYAPVPAALRMMIAVVSAFIPMIRVLVTATFLDLAIKVVTASATPGELYPWLISLGGIAAYEWLSGNAVQLINKRIELTLRLKLRAKIVEKQARLDYCHIENADTWDLYSRIGKEPENRINDGYSQLLDSFVLIVTMISVFGLLVSYAWWVALLAVALMVPMVIISLKAGKQNYDAEKEATKYDRRHDYLFDVMNSRENVEERSLFGYVESIVKQYDDQFSQGRKIRVKMIFKWMARSKAAGIAIGIAITSVFFALLGEVTAGRMSAGAFIAMLQALNNIVNMISWSISYLADRYANNREYMKELTRYMALDEVEGAVLEPRRGQELETLEFRDVRFKYPGTDNYVLDGVSFIIENGKHYSFVGANGAGKTTITKLITGLYDEYEGDILINGEDIRTMPKDRLKAFTSCVFQDFAKYQITMRENIEMGCIGATESKELVKQAVDAVELNEAIGELPMGLDNPLGKIESNGQDLSGGQWQRVALARAVASPAPLRILDEPTAALDPMSESAVYSQFEKISHGMSTIFISHRLGSTKLADKILVIDGGKVKETGTHDELMANSGVYARMYENQRSWYQ